jgi:DNA-directed RNA polymerase subunit RPC12/RpoP
MHLISLSYLTFFMKCIQGVRTWNSLYGPHGHLTQQMEIAHALGIPPELEQTITNFSLKDPYFKRGSDGYDQSMYDQKEVEEQQEQERQLLLRQEEEKRNREIADMLQQEIVRLQQEQLIRDEQQRQGEGYLEQKQKEYDQALVEQAMEREQRVRDEESERDRRNREEYEKWKEEDEEWTEYRNMRIQEDTGQHRETVEMFKNCTLEHKTEVETSESRRDIEEQIQRKRKEIEPFLVEGKKLESWQKNQIKEIALLRLERESRDKRFEEERREKEEYQRLKKEREEKQWKRYARIWRKEEIGVEEEIRKKEERARQRQEKEGTWRSVMKRIRQAIQSQGNEAESGKRDMFEEVVEKNKDSEVEKKRHQLKEAREKEERANQVLSMRAKATALGEVDKTQEKCSLTQLQRLPNTQGAEGQTQTGTQTQEHKSEQQPTTSQNEGSYRETERKQGVVDSAYQQEKNSQMVGDLIDKLIPPAQTQKILSVYSPHTGRLDESLASSDMIFSKTTHLYEKPTYICEVCSKKYESKGGLSLHKKNKHGIQKPKRVPQKIYKCDFCYLKYKEDRKLFKHIELKHRELSFLCLYKYPCGFCNKVFSFQHNLLMHWDTVHPNEGNDSEKRFCCSFCPTKYFHKSSLCAHINNRHIEREEARDTSNGQELCTCESCNGGFKRSVDVALARQRKYERARALAKNAKNDSSKRSNSNEQYTQTLREPPRVHQHPGQILLQQYKCKICGREFKDELDLILHLSGQQGAMMSTYYGLISSSERHPQ